MFTFRAGQPPQRPPTLAPNPALGGPFRGPYQGYGMPQRNVTPAYPILPNQRTVVPQPSPNFLQQRGQSNFPFNAAGLQQQQAQTPAQLSAQQTTLAHAAHQQQTQGSGASSTLPPHLAQNAAPSLGTAPSVSSQSEVGLDPNDFPALGATPANNSSAASSGNTASYATQAGTGAGASGAQAGNGAAVNQPRDFTAEDFPALGGQSQATPQQAQQAQQTPTEGHPPGLNGFQHADQQHRQNLLGSLTSGAPGQQQPGLLNLGQTRNVHPGFQSEADKQRTYPVKNNHANAAAWNSPNVNPSAQQVGTFPNGQQNHVQNAQSQTPGQQPQQQQGQHLNAPPGVPPPAFSSQQPTPAQQTPYVANGTVAVPQTPAQQVLMSPADRWGLLGLLALIKSGDPDSSLLAIGTDLGTMGLDMQNPGSLYSTFITPWADSSAAHTVEPDFHLPACYNVQPPPPGPNKAAAFSDETLFFMFYASPRDALQEIAAQELYNRNWRYHKELRLWLTKETGTQASQKVPGGEQGTYSYWDPEMWEKARKEMTVLYSDLEEKSHPLFAPGQTLQINAPPQPHTPAQPARVGSAFQGIAMGAM
ncbi:uncharacterized protein TRAVEDRAFT_53845 [Trametes versicolor FP-101664 SS1]|uniref:uncharacterized protein n=1 Tax=Trametes versicolor (strain FP-101664) TaxID=717944 RepID=UPI00046231DA|nr:uncharacterized protein TRAVEDRAFT_53845 [Trametes versicolor FP-101664 SS1]EIW52422.1 hypothetical protein TRAVEDRAFT_53845 [Trametes versicolor FP-101664 SS1]